MTIDLTKEQIKCVEYPLDKKVLVIDADPGTGKTEILKHRVGFIYQQNQEQRKFILILAFGRQISESIKRKLKIEGFKVIHTNLKSVLPEFQAKIKWCKEWKSCARCLEKRKPIITVCTIHSLAYWIVSQVFNKQFQEKKKIKILTTSKNKEVSFAYKNQEHLPSKEIFHWMTKEIKSKKSKIFNYLFAKLAKNKIDKSIRAKFWQLFQDNIQISKEQKPYHHWRIENYEAFLEAVDKLDFADKITICHELRSICAWNQTKNIWLDFEDMIENVLLFTKITWPLFDYILVDECQDLKHNLLSLITEKLSNSLTNFTFVGDPKQNIMAFAGATEDIFKLLKDKFPDRSQMVISISFRVPREIAEVANDFTSKFTSYQPKLKTEKTNGGQKPFLFVAGQTEHYQTTPQVEEEISQRAKLIYVEEEGEDQITEKQLEKLKKKLISQAKKEEKIKKQLEFILAAINQLDKNSSKVILYRKNWIGKWLQNWLAETKHYDFATTSSDVNRTISIIINKVRQKLGSEPFFLAKFQSIEQLLVNLELSWSNIPNLSKLIEEFDHERIAIEKVSNYLTKDEIWDFLRRLDKQMKERDLEKSGKTILSTIHAAKGLEFDYVFLLAADEEILPAKPKGQESYWIREEINLFYTAITRAKKNLYLTTSSWENCSRFIKELSPNLLKLIPQKFQGLKFISSEKERHNEAEIMDSPISFANLLEKQGEEAFELLKNSWKIENRLKVLIKNWKEIKGLQIDIYAETKKNIYLIEVKNWSQRFYYESNEHLIRRQEILERQKYRKKIVQENFSSPKTIFYLISFSRGETANDFRNFLRQENSELLVSHHDKIYNKIWATEYKLLCLDEFIYQKEKSKKNFSTIQN